MEHTQRTFLTDLENFITSHPYVILNKATYADHVCEHISETDTTNIVLPDPHADYEEIRITINHIA